MFDPHHDRLYSAAEDMAHEFNTILKGYLVPNYARWLSLKYQIMSFHDQQWRRMIVVFWSANFALAASLVLVMSLVQTIYTVLAYYL